MRPTIDDISTAFIDGLLTLSDEEQRLARAVYRLVGSGRPAPPDAIAQLAGWTRRDAEERLRSWPAVFWNDDGEVEGFWGLAAGAVTHHRLDLEGLGTGWTWCAYDTLFIPGLLDVAARVDSVALYTVNSFGSPTVLLDSGDGLPDTFDMARGAHAHANWAFRAAGTYTLTFEVAGTTTGGAVESSGEVAYQFVVGS